MVSPDRVVLSTQKRMAYGGERFDRIQGLVSLQELDLVC